MRQPGQKRPRASVARAFKLSQPVGEGVASSWDDLRQTREALAMLGYYPEDQIDQHDPGPAIDRALDVGLRRFQTDQGLKSDGRISPGGPTEQSLRSQLREDAGPRSYNPVGNNRSEHADKGREGYSANRERADIGIVGGAVAKRLSQSRSFATNDSDSDLAEESANPADFVQRTLVYRHYTDFTVPRSPLRDVWQAQGIPIPTLNLSDDRVASIVNDTPAVFDIADVPGINIMGVLDGVIGIGVRAVRENDAAIRDAAERHGVDPDLVRAIVYRENAAGFYDTLNPFGEPDSIRPMNIHVEVWSDFIRGRDIWNPEINIDVGTELLARIIERVENPTVARVASIYHVTPRESVETYGAVVADIYENRPWRDHLQPHLMDSIGNFP